MLYYFLGTAVIVIKCPNVLSKGAQNLSLSCLSIVNAGYRTAQNTGFHWTTNVNTTSKKKGGDEYKRLTLK